MADILDSYQDIYFQTEELDEDQATSVIHRIYEAARMEPPKSVLFVDSPIQVALLATSLETAYVDTYFMDEDEVVPPEWKVITHPYIEQPVIDATLQTLSTLDWFSARQNVTSHILSRLPTLSSFIGNVDYSYHSRNRELNERIRVAGASVFLPVVHDINRYILVSHSYRPSLEMMAQFRPETASVPSLILGQFGINNAIRFSLYKDEVPQRWVSLMQDAALHLGPALLFEGVAIVSRRPTLFLSKAEGYNTASSWVRLNNNNPIRFADDTGVWHVLDSRNTLQRVPRIVAEEPESMTKEMIFGQNNQELRRLYMERHGLERVIRTVGGVPLDADKKHGILWEVPLEVDRDTKGNPRNMKVLQVQNSSPEPDGSYKHYYLLVDPKYKKVASARASTFGLKATEFKLGQET